MPLTGSSIKIYRLERTSNQSVRTLRIKKRKDFFEEQVCWLLEGIRKVQNASGKAELQFDYNHSDYVLHSGTWGTGAQCVLDFINWAADYGGKTVQKYLEEFLKYGTQSFEEALPPVIPPPPTWAQFMAYKEKKKEEKEKVKIAT